TQPKHPHNIDYFKDKMLLMQAQENRVALDEEQLLFIAGRQDNVVDEDVDEKPAPNAQTRFMENLSSIYTIYDEVVLSYDSYILSKVHDHDYYQDAVCEHHEVQEMHDDVQPNYIVDSYAHYTSDSNMIPYDQQLKDQVQSRGNTIRELREKIFQLTMKHSEAVPIHDRKALDSQTKELHAKINAHHDLNERWRAENEKVKRHYKELLFKIYDGGSLTASEFHKKFIEIVRFRNDHFPAIMGYGDYVIGDSVISKDETPEFVIKFLKANKKVVAIACYTQNRSLIHTRHNKTLYELVHAKKPNLTFFRVFGALCYPTNNCEDLGKLQPTADIGIFIGYAPSKTVPVNTVGTPSSNTIDQDAPCPSHSPSSSAFQSLSLLQGVVVESTIMEINPFALVDNDPFVNVFASEPSFEASSSWEDRVSEIKDAFGNKQYKPEDIQKLIRKLFNDVQNIHEELAEYINTSSWNHHAFYNYDDDDGDYSIAITPVLSTEEPVDSLIIEDEHLDSILATKSDKVIKSSVEDLVPIPSESEGISNDTCDVPFCDNCPPFDVLNDHFEIFSDFNDDCTSSDDDLLRKSITLKHHLSIMSSSA
nr:retrovirus-related Pol polyprotein from transposon TNT 1-94 [Tanacetum cinerariifolium]